MLIRFGPFPALEEGEAINDGVIMPSPMAMASYRRWAQLAAVGLAIVLVFGALVRKKKKNAEMTASSSLDSKYGFQLTYGQREQAAELTEPLVKAPEQQSA